MRGKFSREFKLEAARLVTERGVSLAQACRDLDLAESVLRRWMREATAAPATAFPGNGQQRAELAETAVLKKEMTRPDGTCVAIITNAARTKTRSNLRALTLFA